MTQPITASLIIIGNEILSGRTQDKNLAHLAVRLNDHGIQLREVRVVPDIEAEIIAAVNSCRARYDYLFTTGGIGPTHDDITTAAIARAFGVPVVRDAEAERTLRAYIPENRINAARLKMADVAQGATLIPNRISAAPGFIIGNVYVMAGIPNVMQAMLEEVLPTLRSGVRMQSISLTTNLPEGTVADGLTAIQHRYPAVDIGSYPRFVDGKGITTLVFRGADDAMIAAAAEETRQLIVALDGAITTES